jgi:hypothetical protein
VGAGFDPPHAAAMTRHTKTPDRRGNDMGVAIIPTLGPTYRATEIVWMAAGSSRRGRFDPMPTSRSPKRGTLYA